MSLCNDSKRIVIDALPYMVIGNDAVVPTLHGPKRYINFDNASSTPAFAHVMDAVRDFMKWYANVHRGTGFKSQLASWVYNESRRRVAEFVGTDLDHQVVIYTKNTTEAINKLSYHYASHQRVVLTSIMEHHSNELPWRRAARVDHIGLEEDGTVSKQDFLHKLETHRGEIDLVAITGASNVSGYINDIGFFARHAHEAGAQILVDGAQLVPHRPINMRAHEHPEHIDFLVFSAHKMYAPFGVGVLIGDREIFEEGDPETVGGGAVDIVNLEDAYWTDLPEKEEAGTPDIIGVVALVAAIEMYRCLGWDTIIDHEAQLTAHALQRLAEIPGVTIMGDADPANARDRLGVITFNIHGISHALAAAVLNHEAAIGVRAGCFCAHSYVKTLLKLSPEEEKAIEREILNRDRSRVPGGVRASFGLYNTVEEIDRLIETVWRIASEGCGKGYTLDRERGEYLPEGFEIDFKKYFNF